LADDGRRGFEQWQCSADEDLVKGPATTVDPLSADGWLEDLSSPWLVGFILALPPTLVLLKLSAAVVRTVRFHTNAGDPRYGAGARVQVLPARHGAHRGFSSFRGRTLRRTLFGSLVDGTCSFRPSVARRVTVESTLGNDNEDPVGEDGSGFPCSRGPIAGILARWLWFSVFLDSPLRECWHDGSGFPCF